MHYKGGVPPRRGVGHPAFVPLPAALAPTIPMTVPIRWPSHHVVGSPPLHPGQALPLWLFLPVRPRIGTDDATPGAHHARAERWHWHVIGPLVRAQDRPMVALPHDMSSDRTPLTRMLPRGAMAALGESCRQL
jgi:hypothetical protein